MYKSMTKLKNKKRNLLLSFVTFSIVECITFFAFDVVASEEFDMSFLHGGSQLDASALLNGKIIPGRYLVDLKLNGDKLGRHTLNVTKEEKEELCFSEAWLTNAGIFFSKEYFKSVYDNSRQCYVLNQDENSQVELDIASQTLTLSIPQLGIENAPSNIEWDYGVPAIRVNYDVNANKSYAEVSKFASAALKANVGKWIVDGNASALDGGADIAVLTGTRALPSWQADLIVGKTMAGDNLLGSTSILGSTLRSSNSMSASDIGYAPVFTGIAKSQARVTLRQNNSVIYSEFMPPGPFAIRDVKLLSSGTVEMSVTEQNGEVHTQLFPLTVVSGMMSAGSSEYTLAAGRIDAADTDDGLSGNIASLAYGYGLDHLTLNTGMVLHSQYQGVSAGLVTSLGDWGGVALESAVSRAEYEQQTAREGAKTKLTYSKKLGASNLHASLSRTLSQDFVALDSFSPTAFVGDSIGSTGTSRDEFNIGVSRPISQHLLLSVSGYRRNYWQSRAVDSGVTVSLGAQIKGVNLSLGATQSISEGVKSRDLAMSASLSLSMPLSLLDRPATVFGTVSQGTGGELNINSGISSSFNERTRYTINAGQSLGGDTDVSLGGTYAGDRANLAVNLGKSETATTGNISARGSMLALPTKKVVTLSPTVSDTVAVVNIEDTPGVRMQNGGAQTDSQGIVVIPLKAYQQNVLTVDAATLPSEVEMGNTSVRITPASQAVTWSQMDAIEVRRYILQVRQADGKFVPSGTWAYDQAGTPQGFISHNGVLMINSIEALGSLTMESCSIPASKIKDSEWLQEIQCESSR